MTSSSASNAASPPSSKDALAPEIRFRLLERRGALRGGRRRRAANATRAMSFWAPDWYTWEKAHWRHGLERERGHWRRKPSTAPRWQHDLSNALLVLLGIISILYVFGAAVGAVLPRL
jgi:hypothetical protein